MWISLLPHYCKTFCMRAHINPHSLYIWCTTGNRAVSWSCHRKMVLECVNSHSFWHLHLLHCRSTGKFWQQSTSAYKAIHTLTYVTAAQYRRCFIAQRFTACFSVMTSSPRISDTGSGTLWFEIDWVTTCTVECIISVLHTLSELK